MGRDMTDIYYFICNLTSWCNPNEITLGGTLVVVLCVVMTSGFLAGIVSEIFAGDLEGGD